MPPAEPLSLDRYLDFTPFVNIDDFVPHPGRMQKKHDKTTLYVNKLSSGKLILVADNKDDFVKSHRCCREGLCR